MKYRPPIGHQNISGCFEHKQVRSLPFQYGNTGLIILYFISDSLSRLTAASQCMASKSKMAVEFRIKYNHSQHQPSVDLPVALDS